MFNKIFFRCMLTLVLWTVGVSIYASFHNATDKTPILLAGLIGIFTVPFSAVLMILGSIKALRGKPDVGLPIVMTGVLLWPVAFMLYLLSAVVLCG